MFYLISLLQIAILGWVDALYRPIHSGPRGGKSHFFFTFFNSFETGLVYSIRVLLSRTENRIKIFQPVQKLRSVADA